MRFLSSVAFAKAPKLMFAASCSAADAISPSTMGKRWTVRNGPPPYSIALAEPALSGAIGRTRTGDDDLAAGLLHGLDGRLGGARDLDGDLRRERALGQQLHAVERLVDQAGGLERGEIDRLPEVEDRQSVV